jgi:murein DD-endopeptidase MepM/ murein hydrolase activator NlpD
MRQVDKKKRRDKVAPALALCFCLIALTSIFTIKASIDKISRSAEDLPVTKEAAADTGSAEADGNEDAQEETEASASAESAADDLEETAETAAKIPTVDSAEQNTEAMAFLCPMDMATAEVSKAYAMDMVVYNLTLDQYMTHPGIDIAGPAGSGVKAVADGTVTAVYTDDAYGITIEITHSNGYVSRYGNLATDKLTEKGDSVSKGQVISNIGKTALYESMEKTHLHFELLKSGEPCDPSAFISFA